MTRKFFLLSFSFLLLNFGFKNYALAQYRDPFTEKTKRNKIKKRNKKGLFTPFKSGFFSRKEKDPFRNINSPKGLVGLGSDPFTSSGKSKYKPSGVDPDSFSYKQRKRAIKEKYNKEYVKKKAIKSREKRYKLKMKYG